MEGYAKVAHLMGKYEEFGILRRFKTLNYQILLHRQAELTHLKQDLEFLVQRDADHPDRGDYVKDWWSLAHGDDSKQGKEQWQKICQIRTKLDEYSMSTDIHPIRQLGLPPPNCKT